MRAMLSVLSVLFVLALTGPASAQSGDKLQEAKNYFAAGKQAYKAKQFSVAATAFEEALKIAPRAPIVFTTAQAYRQQFYLDRAPKSCRRALDLYRRYLKVAPKGSRRGDASQHIVTLELIWQRILAERAAAAQAAEGSEGNAAATKPVALAPKPVTQLMVSSQTIGAVAAIGDEETSEIPVIRVLEPGLHKVRVEAPGYISQTVQSTAVEGRLIVVAVDLQPEPAKLTVKAPAGSRISVNGRTQPASFEVPAGTYMLSVTMRGRQPLGREITVERGAALVIDAPLPRTTQRRVSYYFLGAAGALAVAGGVSTLLTFSAQSDAQTLREEGANLAGYNDARDRRDNRRQWSYGLFGAATAVAAAGALLYWMDNPAPESAPLSGPLPGLVPTVSETGVGAFYVGRF